MLRGFLLSHKIDCSLNLLARQVEIFLDLLDRRTMLSKFGDNRCLYSGSSYDRLAIMYMNIAHNTRINFTKSIFLALSLGKPGCNEIFGGETALSS